MICSPKHVPSRLYLAATPSAIEFAFVNSYGRYCALPAHEIEDGVDPRRVAFTSICPLDPDEVVAYFPGPGRPFTKAANKLAFELLLCVRQSRCRNVLADDVARIEKFEGIRDLVANQKLARRLHVANYFASKRGDKFGDPLEFFVPGGLWPTFLEQLPEEPSLPLLSLSDILAEFSTD